MLKIYQECYWETMKYNLDSSKLEVVAKKYNITNEMAFGYAKDYYMYMLGHSEDNFNELLETVKKENVDANSVIELKTVINNNREMNKLYQELGGVDYREFMFNLQKYCYEYCEGVWFDIDMVRDKAREIGIPYKNFKTYAKTYASRVLENNDFKLISSNYTMDNENKQLTILAVWKGYSPKREMCYQKLGGGTYQEFRDKLFKFSYEYALMVGFDREKIREFGELFDLCYETVWRYIKTYAKDYLLMSEEEYKDITMLKDRQGVDQKVINWINGSAKRKAVYDSCKGDTFEEFRNNLYKMCYEYADSVDFDTEKLQEFSKEVVDVSYANFSSYISKYALEVLKLPKKVWNSRRNKKEYSRWLNSWLDSQKHRELYEIIGGGDYNSIQEKMGKYFYQVIDEDNYRYLKVVELAKRFDLSYRKIIDLIVRYGDEHEEVSLRIDLGIEKIKAEKKNEMYKRKDGKVSTLLGMLENAQDEDRVKIILDGENVRSLYYCINDYVIVHYRDEEDTVKEKITKDLKEKILKYLKNIRKENSSTKIEEDREYIKIASEIIEEFVVKDDFSKIKEFCFNREIKVEEFNRMVIIVKNNNQELYQRYISKINRLRNKGYAILLERINTVLVGIKNGVTTSYGDKREFDLLDYYSITRLPFDNMMKIAKDYVSNEDMRKIKQFVNKYSHLDKITEDDIIEMKIVINGQEIDSMTKLGVISYIENMGLSLNYQLFDIVLKRYLYGRCNIYEENKTKKRTYVNN